MGTLAKNQSKGQASSDRGYTLMELVIVMSILIMVALLSQSWLTSQLPKWRLNGATRQVASDFMGAKMQAVTQGNKHRVTFLDNHHYTILDDDNSNGKPDPGELLVTRNIQTDYIDVTLTSTNNPIFHPRGTASNLGTVTLKNSAGSKSISVGITGRVKLQSSIDNP
jgi:type IV fimbrial biogenesis protein FimT